MRLVAAALLLSLVPTPAHATTAAAPSVESVETIGTSVQGRPIKAYRIGDPGARVKAVVLGAIHGDEHAGVVLAQALLKQQHIKGVDLWVVPTINPDGLAHDNRRNAHGVDLNRNWGTNWAPLTGKYYAGPRRWSEPETRAFRDFIHRVKPRFIVSFHQPLYGVGRSGERPAFLTRLATGLRLPRKSFNCSGMCHGTMTQWYNAHHAGTAVTVEFGRRPSRHYLTHRGVRGTVRAVLGHW